MAMNLDAAIRLSATVTGANNIRPVSNSLQQLSQNANLSKAALGKWNIEINRAAREAGNTTAGIRSHAAALTQLRDRVEIGSKAYRRLGIEIDQLDGKLKKLSATQRGVDGGVLAGRAAGAAAAVAAVGFAAAPVANAGIDREESIRRLRILSDGFDEFARVQDAATMASERFGVSQTEANRSFGQLYARLRPMGFELTTLQSAYNGFNTAAKLSGATSVEASAAFLQLSQALGSGVLRGEELNSVYEQTPTVIQAIAKEMDIPIGQLRAYAKEGKITSDIVLAALARIEAEGARDLAEAMNGPRQQVVNLQNAFQDLQVSVSGTAMPGLILAIQGLTKSIEAATEYTAGLKIAFETLRPVVDIFAGINRGLDGAIARFPQLANVIWTAVGTFLPGLQQAAAIINQIRSMGRSELGRGDGDWNALPAGAWPEGVPKPGTSAAEAARQAELRRISREGAAAAEAERAAAAAAGKPAKAGKTPSAADQDRAELERIRRLPFGPQIIAAAEANQLDPRLFAALVQQESAFNPRAVSRSGAIGLAQLMPGTARELGVDPRDPRQNLLGGARYLRQQIERFGLEGGLRAYNQGPGAQQRTPGGNSRESREYPGRVLARARAFGFGGDGAAEDMAAAAARADAVVDLQKQIAGEREKLAQLRGQVAVAGEMDELTKLNLTYQEKQRALIAETKARAAEITDQELLQLVNAQAQEQYTLMRLEYSRELIALEERRTEEFRRQAEQLAEAQEQAWEFARVRSEGLDTRAGVGEGIDGYMESVGTLRSSIADLTQNGFSALEDAIVSLATTGTASFREMAAAIMADTARMIVQQLVMAQVLRMVQNLMGLGGGAVGGGLGQALGGPLLQGIGNVGFNPIAFSPGLSFSGGGIADGPRSGYPAMLHGTEAVVPLADGRSIPVRMQGGAGAGMNVTVNVDAKGTRAEGDQGRAAQVGRELGQFVEQKILEMRRPGGLLAT